MLGPYAKAMPHQQIAHSGSQARGLAEGVDRAVVVEAEGEREPLIEVALRVAAFWVEIGWWILPSPSKSFGTWPCDSLGEWLA